MSLEANYILGAITIGIGATLLMDLWNLFLKRAFGIPSLNYCLLGRWLRHMPEEPLGMRASPRRRRNALSARLAGLPTTLLVSRSRLCSSFSHPVTGLRDQLYCLLCSTALAP